MSARSAAAASTIAAQRAVADDPQRAERAVRMPVPRVQQQTDALLRAQPADVQEAVTADRGRAARDRATAFGLIVIRSSGMP